MMFVAHDVRLDVAFGLARPRLVSLASSRALVDASRAAYQESLVSLISAGRAAPGPAGPEPTTELARVRFLPPVERAGRMTIGLRWEAGGSSAGLFPVLDADITLAAAGEQTTTLTVSGVYRSATEAAALLGAPVLDALAAGAPLAGPPADVAVRALLRYAAGHLTGLIK